MTVSKTNAGVAGPNVGDLSATEFVDTVDPSVTQYARINVSLDIAEQALGGSVFGEQLPVPELPTHLDAVISSTQASLDELTTEELQIDLYSILELMLRIANDQRDRDRSVRHTEIQNQIANQHDAAAAILNESKNRKWGQIATASMQILGGVAMGAGGVGSGVFSAKAATMSLSAAKLDVGSDAAKAFQSTVDRFNGLGRMSSELGQSASGITGGTGGITQSLFDGKAATFSAEKTELDATSRAHDARAQQLNDEMQQMMEIIRDVLQRLQSMEQLRLQTNQGIARNI